METTIRKVLESALVGKEITRDSIVGVVESVDGGTAEVGGCGEGCCPGIIRPTIELYVKVEGKRWTSTIEVGLDDEFLILRGD